MVTDLGGFYDRVSVHLLTGRRRRAGNVEVTGAARLYRAASVWTAGLANWTFAQHD